VSIDHPHGGSDEGLHRIRLLQDATRYLWKTAISILANVDDDERTGAQFAVFDKAGRKLADWSVGELKTLDVIRFQFNADNKCLAMHAHRVV